MTRLFAVAATLFVVAALIAQRNEIVKLRANDEDMGTKGIKALLEYLGHTVSIEEVY